MSGSTYRPEIDGLRALAVSAVVLFHAGLGLPGGYVGVDIFFVISGFLITGIILRSLASDTFSLVEFWERRVRRIFPALTCMVAVSLAVGCYLLLPADLSQLGKSTIAQAFMLANVYFWRNTDYFGGPAELKPLLHTWSLAVEEQFYLFFPAVLILLKSRSRSVLVMVLGGLAIVSFSASVYGAYYFPQATFFLLPTRAWELLAGSLLATLPAASRSHRVGDEALALAGMACILLSMFVYDSGTVFPGLTALLPVSGTVAILYATSATPNTLVGRLLSCRPVVFVGLISYSMYLWHWPVLAYGRYLSPSMGSVQVAISLILTLGLAILSWRYVEQPFRGTGVIVRRPTVFATAAVFTLVTLVCSVIFIHGKGLPGRYQGRFRVLADDASWIGAEYATPEIDKVLRGELPRLGADGPPGETLDFVLWGDSHGMMLASLVDEVAAEVDVTGAAILKPGIPPLPNLWRPAADPGGTQSRPRSEAVLSYLRATRPRNLLLVGRWSSYTSGYSQAELEESPERRKNPDSVVDREGMEVGPENSTQAVARQLENLIATCEELGIKLWIFRQVPETGEADIGSEFLMHALYPNLRALPSRTLTIADHAARHRLSDQIMQRIEPHRATICDPALYLFDHEGRTVNYRDGRACYRDDDHLTKWGALALRGMMHQVLSEMKYARHRDWERTAQQREDHLR